MNATDFSDLSYQEVVDALQASVDEVLAGVELRLRSEMPVYDRIDRDTLRTATRVNLAFSAHTLRTGGEPFPREITEQLDEIIANRLQLGINAGQMVQGHAIGMREIHSRLVQLTADHHLPAELALAASQLLWTVTCTVLQRSTELMQERMIAAAMREQLHRIEFVRNLIDGQLTGPALELEALAHRLDPERSYLTIRARPQQATDLEKLHQTLESEAKRRSGHSVIVLLGGECVGVVPTGARFPSAISANVAVALGPPAKLPELASSFGVARRVLDWMVSHADTGIRELRDLSWRLMDDPVGDIDAHLHARYLAPLSVDPVMGPVMVASLRAFLAHDRNIIRAAAALVVHPNTLRHRLRRYSELTGMDLDETEVIVGLAWALKELSL